MNISQVGCEQIEAGFDCVAAPTEGGVKN